MMSLNIVSSREIKEKKQTHLWYGAPGKGKTSTVKYLEGKTLVLDIDRTSHVLKGLENIDIVYIDNIDTWTHWEEVLLELTKNYVGVYDNVVVDNVSELERCILSNLGALGKNNGVPSQGDYQYMQFRMVNSLRYMKSIDSNLIWLAWEEYDLFHDFDGTQYTMVQPQINKRIKNNILGLCDVVARLVVKDDGERGFVLTSTNTTLAKNQIDDRKGCLQHEIMKNNMKHEGDK